MSAMFHDGFYCGFGVGGREQLIADASRVAARFQMADDLCVVDFAGAWLVAARRVCYVDVAELVGVL